MADRAFSPNKSAFTGVHSPILDDPDWAAKQDDFLANVEGKIQSFLDKGFESLGAGELSFQLDASLQSEVGQGSGAKDFTISSELLAPTYPHSHERRYDNEF